MAISLSAVPTTFHRHAALPTRFIHPARIGVPFLTTENSQRGRRGAPRAPAQSPHLRAVASAAEAVSGPIWSQIWDQTGSKSQIGHPGDPEVADSIGGPSRTRTLDPLIKSRDQELRTKTNDNPSPRESGTP